MIIHNFFKAHPKYSFDEGTERRTTRQPGLGLGAQTLGWDGKGCNAGSTTFKPCDLKHSFSIPVLSFSLKHASDSSAGFVEDEVRESPSREVLRTVHIVSTQEIIADVLERR